MTTQAAIHRGGWTLLRILPRLSLAARPAASRAASSAPIHEAAAGMARDQPDSFTIRLRPERAGPMQQAGTPPS